MTRSIYAISYFFVEKYAKALVFNSLFYAFSDATLSRAWAKVPQKGNNEATQLPAISMSNSKVVAILEQNSDYFKLKYLFNTKICYFPGYSVIAHVGLSLLTHS